MNNSTNSAIWFLTAYFQFVWRAAIMPIVFLWLALKCAFFFVARLFGGSSDSSGGSNGGGMFSGMLSDLKNIRIQKMGE